jgi:phage gp46-like protein
MPDIQTVWTPLQGRGDWQVAGADLASGHDLATAVLISLFSDAKADPDDVIPDGSHNPRGWWGDAFRGQPLGSKLWLLDRAKQTEATRLAAEDHAATALQWLVDDGIAESVTVAASWDKPGFLALLVTITEPDGRKAVFNYQWAWKDVV